MPPVDPDLGKLPLDLPTPEPETPFRRRKPYRFSTLCATVDNPDMKDQYGSSSVPIYQTATFKGVSGQYDYTRSGNPTRSHLRKFYCLLHIQSLIRDIQNTILQRSLLLHIHSQFHLGWPLWMLSFVC